MITLKTYKKLKNREKMLIKFLSNIDEEVYNNADVAKSFKKLLDKINNLTYSNYLDNLIYKRYGNVGSVNIENIKEDIRDSVLDYIVRKIRKLYKNTNDYKAVIDYINKQNVKKLFNYYVFNFLNISKYLIEQRAMQFEDENYEESIDRIFFEIHQSEYYANQDSDDSEDTDIESENQDALSEPSTDKLRDELLEHYLKIIEDSVKYKVSLFSGVAARDYDFRFSIDQEDGNVLGASQKDRIEYFIKKYIGYFERSVSIYEFLVILYMFKNIYFKHTLSNITHTTRVKKSRIYKRLMTDYYISYNESVFHINTSIYGYKNLADSIAHRNDLPRNFKAVMLLSIYLILSTDAYLMINNPYDFVRYFYKFLHHTCAPVETPMTIHLFDNENGKSDCNLRDLSLPLSVISQYVVKYRAIIQELVKIVNNNIKDSTNYFYKIRQKEDMLTMFKRMIDMYNYINLELIKEETISKHYNYQEDIKEAYNTAYKSTIFTIIKEYKSKNRTQVYYVLADNVVIDVPTIDIRDIVKKMAKSQKEMRKKKRRKKALRLNKI